MTAAGSRLPQRNHPMRKFLYFITFGIILVGAVLFALRLYADELTQIALIPSTEFKAQNALIANAYDDPSMWFSRPGMGAGAGARNDPARWQPAFAKVEENDETAPPTPASQPLKTKNFALFFVHPTSFIDPMSWNAPLDDETSQAGARLLVQGLASAFNTASEIWVPRYRQATFGAFLTDQIEAERAIDAAYQDVDLAFSFFLESIGEDTPIVLAGHSQGSVHILRLLKDRIAGTDLEKRIAMAYPIGWPISIEHDVPALGLPACATPDQDRCVVSWVSYAEPAEPGSFITRYAESVGFDGQIRGDSPILCINPINGMAGGSAPAADNLGTLVPNADLSSAELIPAAVPARCDAQGLLLIGDPPELGAGVLPGNNYHIYDIPLFWKNLQADVAQRMRPAAGQP